jgi:indole-3-glycerol phosphate synthase
MSGDVLMTIMAASAKAARAREARHGAVVEADAARRSPRGSAFRDALAMPGLSVIAECKRRSPSKGILREDYDAVAIARAYASAGAAAISVITEPAFFDGALEHLTAVRLAVDVPLLRKDFLSEPFHLIEARAAGADAVLLIVAGLDDETLAARHREAEALGLAVLVEVHSAEELTRALAVGATIIGVNSRNLRTLSVEPALHEQLILGLPSGVVAVAESGLGSHDDLVRLSAAGYDAFLVGERCVTAPDPGRALEELLDPGRALWGLPAAGPRH